jgi:hypothetical protein
MSARTVSAQPTIIWDDSVVVVFSFQDGGSTFNCGFVHLGLQFQTVVGSATQVSQILQTTTQQGIQVSNDPQTWIETLKFGHRGNQIQIVYDDSTNVNYTNMLAQPFQLQVLYSLSG